MVLNKKYIPIIFQLFGSSLKIIQTAIWDEVHIILTSFYKKPKLVLSISYCSLLIWQAYMILLAIIEGYGFTLVWYRYGLVFLSLFFLVNYYRKFLTQQSVNIFVIVGFGYLIFYLLIILIGKFFAFKVAWWQDWLWAGTSYTSYVIYVIVSLIFILKNNFNIRISILGLAYLLAFLTDSRLTLIYSMLLTLFIGFGLNFKIKHKIELKNLFKILIYLIITIIILINTLDYKKKITQPFRSVNKTIYELINNNPERDPDRIKYIKSTIKLAKNDTFKFILGSGMTSHQYEMIPYVTSSTVKIRPTGLPAVVFDGGLIYLLIIILCAGSSILKFLYYAIKNVIPFWKVTLWVSVIFTSVITLLVVNVTELMLWWAVILSGAIISNKNLNINK